MHQYTIDVYLLIREQTSNIILGKYQKACRLHQKLQSDRDYYQLPYTYMTFHCCFCSYLVYLWLIYWLYFYEYMSYLLYEQEKYRFFTYVQNGMAPAQHFHSFSENFPNHMDVECGWKMLYVCTVYLGLFRVGGLTQTFVFESMYRYMITFIYIHNVYREYS